VICVATFMLILDVTVVNVALPDIQSALHASLSQLEWVVDAYALALGGFLLIGGSLADRYGRKQFFLGGLVAFTLGSLGCSLATSPFALVAARAVQGLGGATLFATALAILGRQYEGEARGRALGVWGAAVALGLAVGPLAGGLLTELVSWRAIFFVNVPIGIGTFTVGALRLIPSAEPEDTPQDWPGAVSFALSLLGLVFALVEGTTLGWTSPSVLGSFGVAAAAGAVFVALERARPGLFDLSLFRRPTFDAATLAVVGQGFVIGPLLFYLVRYLQEVLAASPLRAGMELVPMTVTCFVAALAGGRLASGARDHVLLATSLALLGGGTLLLALVHQGGSWLWLLPGLFVGGVGWGAVNPVAAHGSLEAVPPQRSGMASGINNTARQVGIAIGLGALGSVFQSRVSTAAAARLQPLHLGASHAVAIMAARGGLSEALRLVPPTARGPAAKALGAATTSALHEILVVGAAVAAGCALVVTRLGEATRDA
jgi:EmrB/QacA subfamily drug resistance transporter